MKLKFLSEATLMDLRTNYDDNREHYYSRNNSWFDEYLGVTGRVLDSKVDFNPPEMNKNPDYIISDQKNAKILYESLKHLTPSQAIDERLWAGLAHLQLRDYTFYRLKKELDDKKDKRIHTGIFLSSSGKKRSLYVNVISRLWWVAHMTYDSNNKENPYWLTDFLTERDFSARAVTGFSSNLMSNKKIVMARTKAVKKLQDYGISIKREYFTEANKYLNVIGGARILDALTETEIQHLVYTRLVKYFNLEISEKVSL